jgi:hypothetical protein
MSEIQYSQLVFTPSFLRPRLADERNAVIEPALTAIIASSVQLFFAWRIRLLTKNWTLVALVVVTSLTSGSEFFLYRCSDVLQLPLTQSMWNFDRF